MIADPTKTCTLSTRLSWQDTHLRQLVSLRKHVRVGLYWLETGAGYQTGRPAVCVQSRLRPVCRVCYADLSNSRSHQWRIMTSMAPQWCKSHHWIATSLFRLRLHFKTLDLYLASLMIKRNQIWCHLWCSDCHKKMRSDSHKSGIGPLLPVVRM